MNPARTESTETAADSKNAEVAISSQRDTHPRADGQGDQGPSVDGDVSESAANVKTVPWGRLWLAPLVAAAAWGVLVAFADACSDLLQVPSASGGGSSTANGSWLRWWAAESFVCLAAMVPWIRLPQPPRFARDEAPWVGFWHRVLVAITVATFLRTLGTVALVASGSYQLGEEFGTASLVVLSTYLVVTTAEIWTASQTARRVDGFRHR